MDNKWIEQLLAKTDIIALISRYLPLVRKGSTHWGNCPFHHEKDPSFSISEDKQLYHCFGCKASGNAITFLSAIECIDKMDAIKLLAKEAKMELPQYNSSSNINNSFDNAKREKMYALMRDAAVYYNKNLYSEKGKPFVEYLERRGITNDLVKRFGLGASTGWTDVMFHLEKLGYSRELMRDAGILEKKGDSYYDVYIDRLIFPIINHLNEVVAFGGRTLKTDANFAKYRNTSQTLIFDKSKTIYGINLVKKKKQRERLNYIIMAEGYMDVISLHKAGFDMSVASMGTALTIQQAKILKNYCNNVFICYDGDSAGKKATLRGLDILAEAGLNIKVVSLPDNLDPDDVINKYGKERYQQALDEALNLTSFKIKALSDEYNLSEPSEKTKYTVEAMKIVAQLENPVEREEYTQQIRKITNYTIETLSEQVELSRSEMAREQSREQQEHDDSVRAEIMQPTLPQNKASRFVTACLVHRKPWVNYNDELYNLLRDERNSRILDYIFERMAAEGSFVTSLLYTVFEENNEEVSALLNYEFLPGDDVDKYNSCLKKLRIDKLNAEKNSLIAEYSSTTDKDRQIRILKEIGAIDNRCKQMRTVGGSDD